MCYMKVNADISSKQTHPSFGFSRHDVCRRVSSRGATESPVPEASRACLDRRETKGPEASLDLPVPSASRLVPVPRARVRLACGDPEVSGREQALQELRLLVERSRSFVITHLFFFLHKIEPNYLNAM